MKRRNREVARVCQRGSPHETRKNRKKTPFWVRLTPERGGKGPSPDNKILGEKRNHQVVDLKVLAEGDSRLGPKENLGIGQHPGCGVTTRKEVDGTESNQ